MLVYLALDLIIPLLVYIDMDRSAKVGSYLKLHHILYWMAAFILILVAGMRANSVGTDTGGYLLDAFTESHRVPFSFFYSYSRFMAWDPLFKIVMYFTSIPFSTMFICQTVLSAFAVIPVFLAVKSSQTPYPWLAIFIFTSLLYPMTLNLIRQSIAMALLFLAYVLANKRDYLPAIICLVLGLGFHKSAIIGLGAIPFLFTKSWSPRTYLKTVVPLLVLILLIVIFSKPVLTWATTTLGMYSSYLSGEVGGAPGGRRSLLEMSIFAAVLAVLLINLNSIRGLARNAESRNLAVLCVIGILLYGLCTLSIFLYRIGLYYLYYFILFAPTCITLVRDTERAIPYPDTGAVTSMVLVIIGFSLAISIDYYGICLMNEVVPYALL